MRNQKKNRRSTASMAAQRMVMGSLPQEEDEALQSPMQMVLHSFVRDKIAMVGVILFVFIFLCCVILPYFFPIDLYPFPGRTDPWENLHFLLQSLR